MNPYQFYTEEEEVELYHLTSAEMHTLLDYYFKARAYEPLLSVTEKDKARELYKDGYAKEVGREDLSTYTWEDMLNHESYTFQYY